MITDHHFYRQTDETNIQTDVMLVAYKRDMLIGHVALKIERYITKSSRAKRCYVPIEREEREKRVLMLMWNEGVQYNWDGWIYFVVRLQARPASESVLLEHPLPTFLIQLTRPAPFHPARPPVKRRGLTSVSCSSDLQLHGGHLIRRIWIRIRWMYQGYVCLYVRLICLSVKMVICDHAQLSTFRSSVVKVDFSSFFVCDFK